MQLGGQRLNLCLCTIHVNTQTPTGQNYSILIGNHMDLNYIEQNSVDQNCIDHERIGCVWVIESRRKALNLMNDENSARWSARWCRIRMHLWSASVFHTQYALWSRLQTCLFTRAFFILNVYTAVFRPSPSLTFTSHFSFEFSLLMIFYYICITVLKHTMMVFVLVGCSINLFPILYEYTLYERWSRV